MNFKITMPTQIQSLNILLNVKGVQYLVKIDSLSFQFICFINCIFYIFTYVTFRVALVTAEAALPHHLNRKLEYTESNVIHLRHVSSTSRI